MHVKTAAYDVNGLSPKVVFFTHASEDALPLHQGFLMAPPAFEGQSCAKVGSAFSKLLGFISRRVASEKQNLWPAEFAQNSV